MLPCDGIVRLNELRDLECAELRELNYTREGFVKTDIEHSIRNRYVVLQDESVKLAASH
jgi:hypothetical protein